MTTTAAELPVIPGRLGSWDVVRAFPGAAAAFARRDLAVLLSYRTRVVTSNLESVFGLFLFYYIARLVHGGRFGTPQQYFEFVVVGMVVLTIVQSALAIPTTFRQELVAGTFERLVLSPFGATAAVLALMVFPIAYALFRGTLVLLFATLLFHLHPHWHTAIAAVPLGVLGALAFAPLALVFTAAILVFKQAPGQGAVLAVIAFVSGLYFPVSLLPWWLRWISDVQPFTPSVDLMRHVLVGLPLQGSASWMLLKMAGFVVIGIPAGTWLVAAAGRLARRRGTITEY
ncbi:MAG: ABC transporter permease [Gaiellaceae bacterium]